MTIPLSRNEKYRCHSVRPVPLPETLRVVDEFNRSGMTVSYVLQQYGISYSLLFRWRKLASECGKQANKANDEVIAPAGCP